MGANLKITPPVDETLGTAGLAADAKTVGDRFTNHIKKQTIDGWTCLTLDCGVKVAYYYGNYGNVSIDKSEGNLYWKGFAMDMPSGFFTAFPAVLTQCEVTGGYGLYLALDSNNTLDKLNGWFYANTSLTNVKPNVCLLCLGV